MRFRCEFAIVAVLMAAPWATSLPAQTATYRAPQMPECRPRTPAPGVNAPAPVIPIEPRRREAIADRPTAVEPVLDLARCYLMSWEESYLADADQLLGQAAQRMAATAAVPTLTAPGEPVRVTGAVPARISGAGPAYPATAQLAGIGGLVFIDAVIDTTGAVREARVVGSIPELDAEAQAAVRGWKYAPPVVDGKPAEVIKLVSVRFASDPGITVIDLIDLARFYVASGRITEARAAVEQATKAVADRRAALALPPGSEAGPATEPVLLKHVEAIYPTVARNARISGYVIIEMTVTENGDVVKPIVRKPAMELLNRAALDAVVQWKYRPAQLNGKPVPATVTATVNFSL